MEKNTNRKPRFTRPLISEGDINITDRDIAILLKVARYGFLTSEQLYRIMGGNARTLRDRFTKLHRNHYLDKPAVQRRMNRPNNSPHIYAIGKRGALLLEETHQIPFNSLYWNGKNDVGTLHVEHELLVAELAIRLSATCKGQSTIQFTDYGALSLDFPERTVQDKNPRKTIVSHTTTELERLGDIYKRTRTLKLSAIPDDIFRLSFQEGSNTVNKNFFYEADRGTETVNPSSLKNSTIKKKMIVYLTMLKKGLYQSRYGFTNTRILFITKSIERMEHMIWMNKQLTSGKGSNLFLFTTEPLLKADDNTLNLEFVTGKEDVTTLLA